MDLIEFTKKFPNEKSCKTHFKALRDADASFYSSIWMNSAISSTVDTSMTCLTVYCWQQPPVSLYFGMGTENRRVYRSLLTYQKFLSHFWQYGLFIAKLVICLPSYYEILYLTSIGMLWNGLKTNIKQQVNV